MKKKFKGNYGESENKNFKVVDSIGVPHPYCITPKHLEYSEGMYLDVEGAEKKGAICDICKKIHNKTGQDILSYKEHKQALLISCKVDIKENKELKEYLLKIKDKTEKNGYVGFAFLDKTEN